MGRFKLDKSGIQKIRSMLEHQVVAVEKKLAVEAYSFFVNFGYHRDGGGFEVDGGGYTLFYLANWKCCVNGIDSSVFPTWRATAFADELSRPSGYFRGDVNPDLAVSTVHSLELGDSVSVTNSVDYGTVLNNGGELDGIWVQPNRFVEQCYGVLVDNIAEFAAQVRKECPSI